MKIIVVRHGESEANSRSLLSSKVSDPYGLTEVGKEQVNVSAKNITEQISSTYVSPLLRTQQTADILAQYISLGNRTTSEAIKEIDYGKFSGKKNNPELDKVRDRQVKGDYQIRFGDTGENKYEIEKRIVTFLVDQVSSSMGHDTILVVSHGSVSGWIERIIIAIKKGEGTHTAIKNGDVRRYHLNKKHIGALRALLKQLDKYGSS